MANERTFDPFQASIIGVELDSVLTVSGKRYIIIMTSAQIITVPVTISDDRAYPIPADLPGIGIGYRHIHPSTKIEDVEGARHAWDDGTHWHFAHCSPDEQVDLAAEVRTFTSEQLSLAVASVQVKAIEATNAVLRGRQIAEVKALIEFAEAASAQAYKTVIGETLGHFHRNPHTDHLREQALEAYTVVLADWAEKGKVDRAILAKHAAVRTHVTAVQSVLSTTHTIERRTTRVARLAAEAEAAKQAAMNQGG